MKLGVSAFAWTDNFESSHLKLLPEVKKMGLEGFEVPMFDPEQLPVSNIRRAFEANELECTVCAILPRNINPISPDAAIRRRALQHLTVCVEVASAMGAKLLGGPLYAPIGYLPEHRPNKDEWSWAVELFQSLGEVADEYDVTLAIEPVNRSETFFLRTAREAKLLCDEISHSRIGVTLDTFHANIEEKNIAEAIGLLGNQLKHIHASENDRGVLGTGHVDFPGIRVALEKSGYQGYLMIEGFGYSVEMKSGPGKLWADVGVQPKDIASKGSEYLHGLFAIHQ